MLNLSVCIITKNECENLKICLERLTNFQSDNTPFEIVVIDTGSTDNSKEIARKYTQSVYDFEWCDNFSVARNYAIEKAKHDYILMLDTDEFVDRLDLVALQNLISKKPSAVGRMHRKNLYVSDGCNMISNELVNRLFSKKLYHYEGRIHEQITPLVDNQTDYPTYTIPLFTTHVGYQGEQKDRKKKVKRNLDLLLQELQENGDDPYILFQIGKAYFFDQSYAEAIPYFLRALEFPLDMKLDYVHSIITTLGYCFLYTKQFQDALMLESFFDDYMQDADYMFVLGLIYMQNARFEDAINAFLCATTIPKCTVEGVNSFSAFYNIGVIYECLGMKNEAIDTYEKCGEYGPAKEGINRCNKEK